MPVVLFNTASQRTYEVQAQSILTKVRRLTQDEEAPYRNSDAELLGWLNDAISTVVTLSPQLFTKSGYHVCTAGYRQTLSNARAYALADVVGVPLADMATLTAFSPGWHTYPADAIENWMQPANEPLSFYCYPPSADGQTLPIIFVESPAALTSVEDIIPLPESYEPALTSYCTSMAEMKDDESVDTTRSQQAMADFVGRVKGV